MVELQNDFEWQEDLPEHCPPADATAPGENAYFRLLDDEEPTANDFLSHRQLDPDKKFNTDECTTRSLSIFNDLRACRNMTKLPNLKNKKGIAKLTLVDVDGVVKKTGSAHHYSWWMTKAFNLGSSEVLELGNG